MVSFLSTNDYFGHISKVASACTSGIAAFAFKSNFYERVHDCAFYFISKRYCCRAHSSFLIMFVI